MVRTDYYELLNSVFDAIVKNDDADSVNAMHI